MNITVLDGFGLNPGDLSWEPIEKLGDLKIYDRTAPDQIVAHAQGAEILLTNKVVLGAKEIDALPELKYIGVLATGFNVVDIEAAARRGIIVTNIPSYSTMSVAQMAITLLLTITGRVEHYTEEIRQGDWTRKPDFCYWNHHLFELAGKKIGIVGFGHIGQATARIAQSMGMEPVIFTSKDQSSLPQGMVKAESLDALFAACDVVSLHCPLNDETRCMVDTRRLNLMKRNAILINTARGQLIDPDALALALNDETIYAAGLDVMWTEPPAHDNPLLTARNCFMTPHIGWATLEARRRLVQITADNIKAYLDGKPINVVS